MKKNVVLNWSGGKDATMAFHQLSHHENIEVISLLTSINSKRERITMHGVPLSLLKRQVDALNQQLDLITLPENISMEKYSSIVREKAQQHHQDGISHYAYGDIFLQDLRDFRDEEAAKSQLKTLYPLWGLNTKELAMQFIHLGYKAIVVAVSSAKLSQEFAGRIYDKEFITDLPSNIDPCGENGEFHTFVFDGPLFKHPIDFTKGTTSLHRYASSDNSDSKWDNGVWFCDIS
ncbi:ATP-binding protein [bacterium SCSIO 12643]|nr:ATP-binding protein [bacterium SCSIO 12643]